MKNTQIWITLSLLFFISFVNAQTITYFDVEWDETTKDSASYYRHTYEPVAPDTLYHIQDFYIDGTLQMDGYVTTIEYDNNFIGKVKWYYPNGQLKMFKTYGESLKEFGVTETYLPNGQLRTKGRFEYGTGYDGIVPNSTYAAAYTKMEHGKLVSRLNYYENTTQIAFEDFYRDDEYRIKRTIAYDKDRSVLGELNYINGTHSTIDFGTKVEFYLSYDGVIAKKTISHFENQKAAKEQISYDKSGKLIAVGINKDDYHFDGIFIDNCTQSIVKQGDLLAKVYFNEHWDTISTMIYENGEKWNGIIEGVDATDHFTDGVLTRIRFYSPDKKIVMSKTIFGDPIDSIYWYDKNEKLLGIGIEKENERWDGLFINKSFSSTTLIHYKNGLKEGIYQLYDNDGVTLLSEKIFKNNEVIHDMTRNPLTEKMVECNYPNGKANGIFWEDEEESTYKNGILVKKRTFKETDGQLILDSEITYDTTEDHYKIKEIKFFKGKPYTLFYKNGRRDHGVQVESNALITYQNGDKNGYYEFFSESKSKEKGTNKDGRRHGLITFFSEKEQKQFTCKFENGDPISGDAVKEFYGEYDRSHYENGKRNGTRYNYYHETRITHYLDGKLEGASKDSLDNGQIFTGVYKNNKPYNGTFYDPQFDLGESYVNGKKDGFFKDNLGLHVVIYERYDNGVIQWEQGNYAIGDTIFSEAHYANGFQFEGTFIKYNGDNYIISTYNKGIKDGIETEISIFSKFVPLGETPYKNGIKSGYTWNVNPEYLPKGIEKAVGLYKNDQPFEGNFITNKAFKTWSNFKKGKKDGLEISETSNSTDTIIYKKGMPYDGTQIEAFHLNEHDFFKHHYKNGKRFSSTIEYGYHDIFLEYFKDSLVIVDGYKIIGLHFDDKSKSKGGISFYDEETKLGTFFFENGKINNGFILLQGSKLQAYQDQLEIWKKPDNIGVRSKLTFSNEFSKSFTYQDFYLAYDLLDTPHSVTQYLEDDTYLCKLIYDKRTNTFSGLQVRYQTTTDGIRYELVRVTDGDRTVLEGDLELGDLLDAIKK